MWYNPVAMRVASKSAAVKSTPVKSAKVKSTRTASRKQPPKAYPPLENGQVWQLEDSELQIDLVGKRLVHYKRFRGEVKRVPVSLTGKDELERLLRENNATLIRQ